MKHDPPTRLLLVLLAALTTIGCAQEPPPQAVKAAPVAGACTLVVDVSGMQ